MLLNYILTIAILVCTFCWTSRGCAPNENYNNAVICTSVGQLNEAGVHPEWKTLEVMNFGNESFQPLKNDAFKNFPNLEKLDILGAVNNLEQFVFRGLTKLKRLIIADNQIKNLPDLNFLKELYLLRIQNSSVKSIPAYYFSKLDKLKFIDLMNNSIETIGDCAFCNLDEATIILYNNSLKEFNAERVLGTTSFVAGINLDENKLRNITKFGKMPSLNGITFVNNSIEKIESGSFSKAPKIALIDVSFNRVKEIPVDIFPETIRPDHPFFLILHNNNIECLTKDVMDKFRNLRRVTVSDNPWKCECLEDIIKWAVNMKAFVGCDSPHNCTVSCFNQEGVKADIIFY